MLSNALILELVRVLTNEVTMHSYDFEDYLDEIFLAITVDDEEELWGDDDDYPDDEDDIWDEDYSDDDDDDELDDDDESD